MTSPPSGLGQGNLEPARGTLASRVVSRRCNTLIRRLKRQSRTESLKSQGRRPFTATNLVMYTIIYTIHMYPEGLWRFHLKASLLREIIRAQGMSD